MEIDMWMVLKTEDDEGWRVKIRYSVYDGPREIGFLTVNKSSGNNDKVISFTTLYVLPRFRSKGIGRTLIETALVEYPNAIGFSEPFGGEGCLDQEQLNRFYRSTGARIDKTNHIVWGRGKR